MIGWEQFLGFAGPVLMLWVLSILSLLVFKKKKLAEGLALIGILIHALFIVLFWVGIDRPPMRTMGETRLWYVLFLSAAGWLLHRRENRAWILSYSLLVASVFLVLNLLKPEIHDRNLMPALQSPWFVPHVTAYILSYAFLSIATIAAVVQLTLSARKKPGRDASALIDGLVSTGTALFLAGLLMGAFWAKQAWGHYWSWDPKETWAFATACSFLNYLHLRYRATRPARATLWWVLLGFVLLLMTWKGVQFLPSAQNSIHVYQN